MRFPTSCPSWAWLIPPMYLMLTMTFLCVDVLHWDEWVIWSDILEKMRDGVFGIADLASQQNEQRNMTARMFGLLLMPLFKLNRFAEYALNFLLAAGTFASIFFLYMRTVGTKPSPRLCLAFSILNFSTVQWEAFTFGANSSVLVIPLGIWLGTLVATGGRPSLPRLLALGAIGILPSFSFANGLFYWICLMPLILNQGRKHGTLILPSILWGGMTTAAWGLYFWDFQYPGHHPSLLNAFTQPLQLVAYFFGYLGGTISSDKDLAPIAVILGIFSVGILCHLTIHLRRGRTDLEKILPWLPATAFTLFSGAAIALTRCDFGVGQALESRYVTFSTPYWIALAALFSIAKGHMPHTSMASRFSRYLATACAGVLILSITLSTIVMYNRHDRFNRARKALYSLTDEQGLKAIFPDTAYLIMKLPLFLDKRLSIYRHIKSIGEYKILKKAQGSFVMSGPLHAAENRIQGFSVTGRTPTGLVQGSLILLFADEKLVGALPLKTGNITWEMFLPAHNLGNGTHTVKAYLAPPNSASISPVAPRIGITVSLPPLSQPTYTVHNYFFTN